MHRPGRFFRLSHAWIGAVVLAASGVAPVAVRAELSASSPIAARAEPAASAPAARAATLAWNKLSPQQQAVLAPLKPEWATIEPARKRKWLDIAGRYSSLPPDEQKRIAERMAEWARLSPDERARARLSFQEAKQLSPQERQARWEAYQALPEAERKALQARAVPAGDHAALSGRATPDARAAGPASVRPVAPTVVQARPGATTTLMSQKPAAPLALQPGAPRIAAQPAQVDPATLLPQTGPQAPARATPAPEKPPAAQ